MNTTLETNCLGYVLFRLGLIPHDVYVKTGPLAEFKDQLETCDPHLAQGLLILNEEKIIHAAALIPGDPAHVNDRPGVNLPHVTRRLEDVLEPYDSYINTGEFTLTFVRAIFNGN